MPNVHVLDPTKDPAGFESLLAQALANGQLTVLIARRPCLLAAAAIRQFSGGRQPESSKPGYCRPLISFETRANPFVERL